LALAASAPAPAGEFVYLHVIPVTASADAVAGAPGASDPPSFRVSMTGPEEGFAPESLAALGASVVDGQAVFTLGAYPRLGGEVTGAHRAATFVVDFDEPEVRQLSARLVEEHGESPAFADLIRFTGDAISVKTMARGWDVASRIARSGEGDCTEHAVLLTALARAAGLPARVVVGFVLVWSGGSVDAYGHAWTEIHDGTDWRRVDGTAIDRQATVRYVPMAAVTDEGPGYQFHLFAQLASTWPRHVELDRVDEGAGKLSAPTSR
jgi:hypothetical protein